MNRCKYFILIGFILSLFSYDAFAQSKREIKGIVLGAEDKLPLIGANIVAADVNKNLIMTGAAICDLDGRFSISVNSQAKYLQVSYIGYETKMIEIGAQEFITARLKTDTKQIEAVVVTGYGTIEKRKLTASVDKIEMSDKMPQVAMSVDQMLQGQLAGVSITTNSGSPGAPAKIRIRGTSSLNGTQDPLWVMDGIPLEGTDVPATEDAYDIDNLYSSAIAGVNPADIADITVLKDAAATAIYGARAANGVIVITTKKGKKGKLRVNYSGKTSVTLKPNISRLNLLNADQKVSLELDLLSSDYDYLDHKGAVSRIIAANEGLDAYRLGGMNSLSANTQSQINALRNINTDWNDLLFRNAFSQDHALSISGGDDKATYYFSAGYYDEKGATKGVDVKRYNLTAKTEFKFSRKLKFGIGLMANQRENSSYLTATNGHTNPVKYSRMVNPYLDVYNEDGSYRYDPDIQGYDYGEATNFNIIEERNNTENKLTNRAFNSNFNLEYRLFDALKFTSQFGLQYQFGNEVQLMDYESYANRYEHEKVKFSDGSYLLPKDDILKNGDRTQFQYTWKNMLRYSEIFGTDHEFEIMVGNEIRKTKDDYLKTISYAYDSQSLTSEIVDISENYKRTYPTFLQSHFENAFVSYFATSSYTFKRKYTLGASIRFDGSDLFGVDPKYRYLPLYSLSGLWRASEEDFLKNISWLNALNLRVSYGLQGNIDKNTSPKLVGEWGSKVSVLGGESEKNITVLSAPNDKLRWEKTQNYNFGFDAAVFNNRLRLGAEIYYRYSSDLIGLRALNYETGFDYQSQNWSSITNKGFELNLGVTLLNKEDLKWSLNFNVAHNENEANDVQVRDNDTYPSINGHSVGAIFVLPYAGLDSQGYPLLYNSDGSKVTIDKYFQYVLKGASPESEMSYEKQRSLYVYGGTRDPKYSGGISTNLVYKSWDLNISTAFNLGHKVLISQEYNPTKYDRGLNTSEAILNRWTPNNTNTNYPRLITTNTENGTRKVEYSVYDELRLQRYFDMYLRDASYLRVQSIRLGYRFSDKVLKKLRLGGMKLNFEARNPFVFAKDYDGYLDPETLGNIYAQPIPKSFTVSLNFNF